MNPQTLKEEFCKVAAYSYPNKAWTCDEFADVAVIADWWLEKMYQERARLLEAVEWMKRPNDFSLMQLSQANDIGYNQALEDIKQVIGK